MDTGGQGSATEKLLEVLLVERAVRRCLEACAGALDRGDCEAFAACFTDEGRFEARAADGASMFAVAGRAELLEFGRRHTRPPVQVHQHHVGALVVGEAVAGAVVCRSRLVVLMADGGVPVVRAFGSYDDELRRDPDGRWRIERRVATVAAMLPGAPPFAYGMPSEG